MLKTFKLPSFYPEWRKNWTNPTKETLVAGGIYQQYHIQIKTDNGGKYAENAENCQHSMYVRSSLKAAQLFHIFLLSIKVINY